MRSIEERARFDFIRYANCWEDPALLIRSFGTVKGKRLVSVASAGDNSLSLLSGDPEEVVAIDLNQTQLAACELRILAIRNLDYEGVLQFLGILPSPVSRLSVWHSIRDQATTYSRQFWDRHTTDISTGVIHAGKFERYLTFFGMKALPFVQSRRKIQELITEKTIEDQRSFYEQTWNNTRWNLFFHVFFSKQVMGLFGRDPQFFKYVEGSVADRILNRTKYALTEISTSSNPYLRYILTKSFEKALPHYLQPGTFPLIKANLDRIRLVHGPIQVLAEQGCLYDGFNLSDIFEYMSEELFKEVVSALERLATPGARFAYWNLLIPRDMETVLPGRLKTDKPVSAELHKQDRAWFYSDFHVTVKV